jgi:hypothetical protein
MDIRILIDTIGWTGSGLVVLAYGLVSTNRLEGNSIGYQILNLLGAIFLLVNTVYFGAFPSSFTNIVWITIAIVAIARAIRK